MKTCENCGTQLGDEARFCHICGGSQLSGGGRRDASQQLTMPRNMFYLMMVALAVMGLIVAGLAIRGPTVVTETESSYVTQMQYTTYTANFVATTTETQGYTVTMGSFTTLPAGPPPSWFSGQ